MKLSSLAALSVTLVAILGACSSKHTNPPAIPSPSAVGSMPDPVASATFDAAFGTPVIKIVDTSGNEKILTDASGNTLYVLNDDVPSSGISTCTGDCATTWPPLTIPYGFTPQTPGLGGSLGSFRRGDGQRQVMYEGNPLYRYSGDRAPGDTNGQGLDGRWSVAAP